MIAFQVENLTSVHGVNAITRAVKAADNMAKVEIDLVSHRVWIEPAKTEVSTLRQAISEAGYTPVDIQAAPDHPVTVPASAHGSLWWG